jgi:hypothetical protein
MLFLVGMDKKYELIEPLMTCHCQRCGEERQWSLYKETELASLFFITVWRFTPDYFLVCDVCQDMVKLSRMLGKQLVHMGSRDQKIHDEVEGLVIEHQTINDKS